MKTRGTAIKVFVCIIILAVSGALYAQEAGLQPGDRIGDMSLTTGGAVGPPIWAFCSPAFLNPGVTTTECTVPPLPAVTIGHGQFSADEALRDVNWAAMSWELYVDGQQVDLGTFGTYDADLPQTGLPGDPAGEEVITKVRSYDVVLVNPTLGAHTLRSVMVASQEIDDGFHTMAAGTYELVVHFTVAAPPALPETGGTAPVGTLPPWLAIGGLLILTLTLGLGRRVVVRHKANDEDRPGA